VPITSTRDQHQHDTAPRVIMQEEDKDDEIPRIIGEKDGPRYMTRNQKRIRGSITTDVMLTVIQLTRPKLNTQKLASRKYPLEMLCEFANAVI
jgi:hypothetical protein